MSQQGLPWSFYAVMVTFGIFFFSLNVYILTMVLFHPLQSNLWLIGVVGGFLGLLYSLYMTRVHQQERVRARQDMIAQTED